MADDHHYLGRPGTTNLNPVVAAASGGVAAAESSKSTQDSDKELEFTGDEETLIIRMYNLVGERWPLIAGRIPGRSAEEIEKYWDSRHATSRKQAQN